MTLTQPIAIAKDDGKDVMGVTLAALMLFAVIALLIPVGVHPAPAEASAHQTVAASPIANASEPACAAALSRARDTRGLSAEDAIAASTAMLRACEIR